MDESFQIKEVSDKEFNDTISNMNKKKPIISSDQRLIFEKCKSYYFVGFSLYEKQGSFNVVLQLKDPQFVSPVKHAFYHQGGQRYYLFWPIILKAIGDLNHSMNICSNDFNKIYEDKMGKYTLYFFVEMW